MKKAFGYHCTNTKQESCPPWQLVGLHCILEGSGPDDRNMGLSNREETYSWTQLFGVFNTYHGHRYENLAYVSLPTGNL